MITRFPQLPSIGITSSQRRRICIATWEIEGPSRNAGIGSAYASLAGALKRAGHDVTILFLLGCHPTDGNIIDWIDHYEHQGLKLIPLPMAHHPRIHAAWASSVSYHSYVWLKEHQNEFDIIHFPECQGLAFYSLLAKRQGLAFGNTMFVISTHGPTLWVKEGSQDYLRNLGELEIDFMERTSVSAADVVVSPSQYLLGWMQQNGWELPPETYVAPYVLPDGMLANRRSAPQQSTKVRELVFFGRLELRKGLKLFCDALDELCADSVQHDFEVSFLGKETLIYGCSSISYISDRSKQWPIPWRIVSNRFRNAAIDYLQQPGRLAVVASLSDNFPNTVLECTGASVPLLASNVGGIPEIIDPADREAVCFEPRPHVLAERLRAALQDGALPPHPSASFAETNDNWVRWHAGLKQANSEPTVRRTRQARKESIFPLLTVCFAYNTLDSDGAVTLASLKQQDYPHFEIIIAECVNHSVSASGRVEHRDEASQTGGSPVERIQRIRIAGAGLGAARNVAVQEAKGEYLFFVDDHSLLLAPNALSVFVQVAQRVSADIVTSAVSFFFGSSNGASEERLENSRRVFLGGDLATGAFVNCFGSSNALVRREAFDKVGGFSDEAVSTIDDWEFFAKAALAGLSIETMPEVFLWQREDQDRESLVHSLVNAVRGALRELDP